VSYILDALRKSDQLRRRNAAPTLLLEPAPALPPRQAALFAYGLLALVLLGAGIAIGWLRPWQSEPELPAPSASSARLPEPHPAPQTVTAPTPTPAPALQRPAPAATGPASASAAPLVPPHTPLKAVKKTAVPAPVPVAKQAPSASSSPVAAAPAAVVMMMAELPLAIQQELPPMSISVHAYSGKAADRLVGINGRLLHEGDSVAPGLALEQITPDGMIFSYKGYTFRHGVR